ncbi:MAG: hypothetical protein JXQ87_01275 [Bacteroidia bacterium]
MFYGHHRDIPTIFFDTITEEPIQKCQFCEKDLLKSDEPYIIEKAFRKTEVVFEYAICMPCADNMRGQMSKDSMVAVEKYMLENARFQERAQELQHQEYDTDKWLGNCLVNDSAREEQEEYQIYGMFRGGKMIQNQFPYMMSGAALEEIQELLSPETKDEIDRFKDEYFNIPPELADLFRDPKFTLAF